MTTRPRNQGAVNALRMISTKWAVVLVCVAIAYVVLQPRLNQWFGWSLPSVASLTGDEKPAAKKPQEKETANKNSNDNEKIAAAKEDKEEQTEQTSEINSKSSSKKSDDDPVNKEAPSQPASKQAENKSPIPPTKSATKSKEELNDDDSDPLYGFLAEVGRNRYESPAGLIYGPGSEEGHRLKHIARHLEDQPDRPGSHGVFKGGMKAFLVAIDDAYTRAKKGAKGTTKKEDEGAMVYEVTFDKAIGFIGGEAGGRKKNPPAKKIRLVVRGSNVITAFPF